MTRISIEQLGFAPEFGVLAILDVAADTAVLALAAAHPELQGIQDPDDNTTPTGAALAALSVIEHARALAVALARYRRGLLRERHRDDILPF